jgi:hypothetical protein
MLGPVKPPESANVPLLTSVYPATSAGSMPTIRSRRSTAVDTLRTMALPIPYGAYECKLLHVPKY